MRFVILDDFWQLFPAARIGIVIARELDNASAERDNGPDREAGHAGERLRHRGPLPSSTVSPGILPRNGRTFFTRSG